MAVMAVSLSAQKLPKSVKQAKKAMSAGKFDEALKLIDSALEDESTAKISSAWAIKGDILNAVATTDKDELLKSQVTKKSYEVKNPLAAANALTAYKMALENSTGKKDKGQRAAIKGLASLASPLNDIATNLFSVKKYAESFTLFKSLIQAREILQGFGNKSILPKVADFNTIQYYTGVAAAYAGTPEKATAIYQKLVDAEYPESLPYEQVFEQLIEKDEKAAFDVMAKGRKACAEDPSKLKGFLFKEINYYLKQGKTDVLESKLQEAIEQDPENYTLHFVLGNVYSDLANDATDATTAKEYTKQSEEYYNSTLKIKPDFADAHVGLGLIHYNKATALNEPIKALADDYSAAGTKKYDALKAQQLKHLEDSAPFFKAALKADSKKIKAMEALRGIAAFKNDTAALEKYKKMIEEAEK